MSVRVKIADLHQDLLSHVEAREVFGDEFQTSLPQLQDSPVHLVVASTFNMHAGARVVSEDNANYSLRLMQDYSSNSETDGFRQILTADDLASSSEDIGLLVHVEGIQAISGEIEEELAEWWKEGCRSVGPMWNLDNGIGGGPDDPDVGLTALGKRAVKWIDAAPMVLDVSHMSEKTFWDTLEETSGVLIASHANARGLTNHPRNLKDDQIAAIADRGGVIGLVLSQRFLGLSRNLDAVLRHAAYIAELVGPEHLAIGSDLGGLQDLIPEVPSVERLEGLAEAIIGEFGRVQADEILWGNAVRSLRESLDAPVPNI